MKTIKPVIALLWYVVAALWRAIRSVVRSGPPRHIILYYHAVPDEHAAKFARQMRTLARHTTPIGLADRGPFELGCMYTSVTFDDAYESVRDNALGPLVEHSIPCTIFAPAENLGEPPKWGMIEGTPEQAQRIMTGEELIRIRSEMVAIGSHTCTHPMLSRIDDDTLARELEASRSQLTALLGESVYTLAFPYGDYDERVVEACRRAGYTHAYSIQPHVETAGTERFVLGRVAVDANDGRLVFFLKRSGAYAWMPAASALKRALLGRGRA